MKKKLQVVATVMARDDQVVRVSKRLEGTVDAGKVVVEKHEVIATLPYEVKVLFGLTELVEQMVKYNVNGTIFVADSVAPRIFQAKKLIGTHNAADIMITSWMKASGEKAEYYAAFSVLLTALRRARNNDVLVIVKPVSELWRVRLNGADGLADGTLVDIKNGISEKLGVQVIGSSRFAGTVTVKRRTERNGSVTVYGDIVYESLSDKAAAFAVAGRAVVAAAMSELPSSAVAVEVAGNF